MKKSLLPLILILFFLGNLQSQNYIQLTDASGSSPTVQEVSAIEVATQTVIDELPQEFQNLFKVYDFGYYSLNESMTGGIDAVWENLKVEVENRPESEYYIIFGRESGSHGVNTKVRVELKLPTSSKFDCFDEIKRANVQNYVEAQVNSEIGSSGIFTSEKEGLELLQLYIYKIIECECSGVRSSGCELSGDFRIVNPELLGLGFRRKEIAIGSECIWANGDLGLTDHFGKQVIIDGSSYCLTEQISEGKAIFDSNVQNLPDTSINTSVSGEVYILDNESFINGEWEDAKLKSNEVDYVEYWAVIYDHIDSKHYLYSMFTIGAIDEVPVALKGGDSSQNRSAIGIIPTWADALKALGNATVDATMQALISYLIDDSVKDWPDAWGKVSYLGATWEGISSLIPWKKKLNGPQAFVVRAAAGAFVVVLDNYNKDKLNYTVNQALVDFGVGFGASAITQLVGHPKVVNVIGQGSKIARLYFAKGVRKLNYNSISFLNKISNNAFKSLAGTINRRVLNEVDDVILINRVKELRNKLLSGQKKSGNFGRASIEDIPELTKREFFAHSQVDDLSNATLKQRVPEISTKPSNSPFPYETIPSADGTLIDRNVDSEFKILTEIANRLGNKINASGKIKLFTERDACTSCANVIGMFSAIYKNIEIELIHNSGTILKP